jgi:hypothetical protein
LGNPIDTVVKNLFGKNKTIGAVAILDYNGRVLYTTQNWRVDGSRVINSWRRREPSVLVQNVKYSTLQATEERLVATNVYGKGHIVMSTIRGKGMLIAYVLPKGDAQSSYADITRTADQISHVIS